MLQAEAEATNAIDEVVKDWIDSVQENPKAACTDVAANTVVEGVAEAVSKAFTTVANTVSTDASKQPWGILCGQ